MPFYVVEGGWWRLEGLKWYDWPLSGNIFRYHLPGDHFRPWCLNWHPTQQTDERPWNSIHEKFRAPTLHSQTKMRRENKVNISMPLYVVEGGCWGLKGLKWIQMVDGNNPAPIRGTLHSRGQGTNFFTKLGQRSQGQNGWPRLGPQVKEADSYFGSSGGMKKIKQEKALKYVYILPSGTMTVVSECDFIHCRYVTPCLAKAESKYLSKLILVAIGKAFPVRRLFFLTGSTSASFTPGISIASGTGLLTGTTPFFFFWLGFSGVNGVSVCFLFFGVEKVFSSCFQAFRSTWPPHKWRHRVCHLGRLLTDIHRPCMSLLACAIWSPKFGKSRGKLPAPICLANSNLSMASTPQFPSEMTSPQRIPSCWKRDRINSGRCNIRVSSLSTSNLMLARTSSSLLHSSIASRFEIAPLSLADTCSNHFCITSSASGTSASNHAGNQCWQSEKLDPNVKSGLQSTTKELPWLYGCSKGVMPPSSGRMLLKKLDMSKICLWPATSLDTNTRLHTSHCALTKNSGPPPKKKSSGGH